MIAQLEMTDGKRSSLSLRDTPRQEPWERGREWFADSSPSGFCSSVGLVKATEDASSHEWLSASVHCVLGGIFPAPYARSNCELDLKVWQGCII